MPININFTPGAAAARERNKILEEQQIESNTQTLAQNKQVADSRLMKRKMDSIGNLLQAARSNKPALAKLLLNTDIGLKDQGITNFRIEEDSGTITPGSAGDLPSRAKGLTDPNAPSSRVPKGRRIFLTTAEGDFSVEKNEFGEPGEPTAFSDRDIDSLLASAKKSVKMHKGFAVSIQNGEVVSIVDLFGRVGVPRPKNREQRNSLTTAMTTSMRNSWDAIKATQTEAIDTFTGDGGEALGRVDKLIEDAIQKAQELHEGGQNMGGAVQIALDQASVRLLELIKNNPNMAEPAQSAWDSFMNSLGDMAQGALNALGFGQQDPATRTQTESEREASFLKGLQTGR